MDKKSDLFVGSAECRLINDPAVFVTDQIVVVNDDTVDIAGRDVLFDLGIIDRSSPREHTGEYDREDQDQYHAEHDPEQYFGCFTHDNSLQIIYCYISASS